MTKNLIFVTSTFMIPQHTPEQNLKRQNLYYVCYLQLDRVVDKEKFDLVYCDNSISSIEDIQDSNLKRVLDGKNLYCRDTNKGIGNIGIGELDELIHISEQIDFTRYDKVVYFTGRRVVANPWIFDKVLGMKENILVSNPPFFHFSPNVCNFDENYELGPQYNDMFFAMSADNMLKYVEYSRNHLDEMRTQHYGSEQNLYRFIKSENFEYDWLEMLGLIRVDYQRNNELQLI